MYLGHWDRSAIQCLSNSCAYREGDSAKCVSLMQKIIIIY